MGGPARKEKQWYTKDSIILKKENISKHLDSTCYVPDIVQNTLYILRYLSLMITS